MPSSTAVEVSINGYATGGLVHQHSGPMITPALPFYVIPPDDGNQRLVRCEGCDVLWSIKLEPVCWMCGGDKYVLSVIRDKA